MSESGEQTTERAATLTATTRSTGPVAPPRDLPPVADPAERVFATSVPGAPTRRDLRPRRRVGVDWPSWAATSLVLTAFFVLIVSGRVVTEGPVLLVLTRTHGIHEGDLFALAAACGGIALPVLRGLRRR